MPRSWLLAAVAVIVADPCAAPAQTTATWTGATGNWTDAALWSTNPNYPNNGTPAGATYNAVVNGNGTLTLDAPITIEQLDFSSGTISGPNNLTLNAASTWSGGLFSGGGTTFANNGLTFAAVTQKNLDGRNLTLAGVAGSTWSGGNIGLTNGAVLTVASGSSLITTANGQITAFGGTGSLVVNGTFRKQTAAGTTTIGSGGGVNILAFTNAGLVDVQAGTVDINPGTFTSTGSYSVSSGATLQFSTSGAVNQNGSSTSSVSGPGAVTFGNLSSIRGTVDVNVPYTITGLTTINGRVNFNVPVTLPNLTFDAITSGLAILGGSGAVTLPNLFTWTGGTITGTGGTITAQSGVAFTGGTNKLDGRSLTLTGAGGSSWSGGTISVENGAALTVAAGTTLTTTIDSFIQNASGNGTGSFVVNGTFSKQTATGVTQIGDGSSTQFTFTNAGLVEVQAGVVNIVPMTFISTGSYSVSSGATLQFASASALNQNGSNTASVSGAGAITIAGGVIVDVNIPYTVTGLTTIAGNRMNFNVPVTLPSLTITGILGGSGAVTLPNNITWNRGTITGTGGTITAAAGVTFVGLGADNILDGRNLTLGGGTSTWSSLGARIILSNGPVLTNAAASTFVATGDANIFADIGGGSFVNSGTFRKQTGTGTTAIGSISIGTLAFTNGGTLEAASGILLVSNNDTFTNYTSATTTLNGGTYRILTNSTLDFDGRTVSTLTAGTTVELNGAGSVFTAVNSLAANNGTFRLAGSRNFTTAGDLTNAGTLDVQTGSTLTVSGNYTNNGTVTGAGTIAVTNATFTGGNYNTTGTLSVSGTLIVTGTTSFTSGTVNVAGTTAVNSPLTIATGATLGGNGGVTIPSGSTLTVSGAVGTSKPVNVTGTLQGSGTAGAVTLNAGALLQGSGGTLSLSTLTIVGNSTLGNTVNATGATAVNAGTLTISDGATFGGAGSLNVVSGAALIVGTTPGSTAVVAKAVTVSGLLGGHGTASSSVIINNGAIISPGNSPGTITVGSGITINGEYDWELNGNTIMNPGVNYDRVNVTGGNAVLGPASALKIVLIQPPVDLNNSFWSTPEQWTVLQVTGGGTASGNFATITNATFSQGSFSTVNTGTAIQVNWMPVPVPEPATVLLTCALGGMLGAGWRRRRTAG